jgi:toxin ParE1/3/4
LTSPAAARRFQTAAADTFTFLERLSCLGSPYPLTNPALQEIRCWLVKGFRRHLIFYRAITGEIEVLHVFHGAQDIAGILEEDPG